MSDPLGLERPRLSRAVEARMHVVDGVAKVVLSDTRDGLVAEIEPESWTVLTLADGTRDLDALALACAREGVYRSEAELVELLAALSEAGLLADGLEPPAPAPPVAPDVVPPDRPLSPLEGFTLVCDGRGSCCRFYGSVAFDPRAVLDARLAADELGVTVRPERLFTPVRGAQVEAGAPQAVALVDGCCAFLERDGRCGVHRVRGAAAKPVPCRLYPMTLVDDGESVRVSAAPECACVFASVGRADGAPLIPNSARTIAELGDVGVMTLPDPVPISFERVVPRTAYVPWSAWLSARLATTAADAVALALALADAIERDPDGLAAAPHSFERVLEAPPRARGDVLVPRVDALCDRAGDVAAQQERWRSASDLSRRVARWIVDALESNEVEPLLDHAADPGAERFYLRALAHGHRLAVEGRPLVDGLRERATRLIAARAMARIEAPEDTASPYPLAMLEAAMRNLRL